MAQLYIHSTWEPCLQSSFSARQLKRRRGQRGDRLGDEDCNEHGAGQAGLAGIIGGIGGGCKADAHAQCDSGTQEPG